MSEKSKPDLVLICGRDPQIPLSEYQRRQIQEILARGKTDFPVIIKEPIDIFQRIDGRWEYVGPKEPAPAAVDVEYNAAPAVRFTGDVRDFVEHTEELCTTKRDDPAQSITWREFT